MPNTFHEIKLKKSTGNFIETITFSSRSIKYDYDRLVQIQRTSYTFHIIESIATLKDIVWIVA